MFSYNSHLNTSHFFSNVHVRVASRISFFKYVYFKHVKRILPKSLERKYFSVHIAIFYKFAFHSFSFFYYCKLRHCIFCFFFNFYEMHCFELRRRELLCPGTVGRPTSIKWPAWPYLAFNMVKGSILKVKFLLISRGKKLN